MLPYTLLLVKVLLFANLTPVGGLTLSIRRPHAAITFADPSLPNIVDLLPDFSDIDVENAALLLIIVISVVLDAYEVPRALFKSFSVVLCVGLEPSFRFYVDLIHQVR